MAFQYLESLIVEPDLDGDDESDIEVEPLDSSDSEDESDNRPSTSASTEKNNENWSDDLTNVTVEEFTEYSGPVHDLPPDSEPLDYFKLFFTDGLIDMIVLETNKYAEQQQVSKGQRDPYWKPVTADDIYKYIYTLIVFGLHPFPEIRLYWSSDPFWRVSAIADVWGRQRFQKVHQYLHMNDNTEQPARGAQNFDPLYKVRPILDHIRSTASTVYKPMQKISVDEAMIAFTGQISFRQYIKNKPTPWGFKVWCCAEASTGYLLNFQVYTGKHNDTAHQGQGLGSRVVQNMIQGHLGKNHKVYFDNFFSTVGLAQDLLRNNTYCCSTIRPNRKEWPLPKDTKQKAGEVKMKQKGNLVAVQWTDKRQVNVLSTCCDPTMTTVQRRKKGGGLLDVPIPSAIVDYNSAMFGVDLNDQYRSYYGVGRPGNKWWRYLFNYLIQISIINSFILMKRARTEDNRYSISQNHLMFRTALAKALATPSKSRAAEAPTLGGAARAYSPEHTLAKMPGRKRRCFQCARDGNKMPSGRTRETITGCPLCNVHLHGGPCYLKFHEALKQ